MTKGRMDDQLTSPAHLVPCEFPLRSSSLGVGSESPSLQSQLISGSYKKKLTIRF